MEVCRTIAYGQGLYYMMEFQNFYEISETDFMGNAIFHQNGFIMYVGVL